MKARRARPASARTACACVVLMTNISESASWAGCASAYRSGPCESDPRRLRSALLRLGPTSIASAAYRSKSARKGGPDRELTSVKKRVFFNSAARRLSLRPCGRHHAANRCRGCRFMVSGGGWRVTKPALRALLLHNSRRRTHCQMPRNQDGGSSGAPGRLSSARDRVPASYRPRPASGLVARRL